MRVVLPGGQIRARQLLFVPVSTRRSCRSSSLVPPPGPHSCAAPSHTTTASSSCHAARISSSTPARFSLQRPQAPADPIVTRRTRASPHHRPVALHPQIPSFRSRSCPAPYSSSSDAAFSLRERRRSCCLLRPGQTVQQASASVPSGRAGQPPSPSSLLCSTLPSIHNNSGSTTLLYSAGHTPIGRPACVRAS
jgi:hypothetical protein